jgi:hypothetical protein
MRSFTRGSNIFALCYSYSRVDGIKIYWRLFMKTNRRMKVSVITLITAELCCAILFSGCPGAGVENEDETGTITGTASFSSGD